ncbi:MAG: diguanylate cyclase (GGDEF)-like protein [Paraglaciecola sp.]|jgi:diguanylate cyclase (GGDEF)-like protein
MLSYFLSGGVRETLLLFGSMSMRKFSRGNILHLLTLKLKLIIFYHKCYFLTLLLLSLTIGFGRGDAIAEPLILEPKFLQLSTKNGLPQDSINDILLDKEHFLWIATEDGLVRFDGYRNILVTGQNNEFSYQPIYKLSQDSSGKIWVSTALTGVHRFDPESGETKSIVDLLSFQSPDIHQYAEKIREQKDGSIWIAMTEEVLRFDPVTEQVSSVFSLTEEQRNSGMSIRDIWLEQEILYVASVGGLIAFDTNSQTQITIDYLQQYPHNDDSTNVKYLFKSPNGRLLIATVEGLYSLPFGQLNTYVIGHGALPKSQMILPQRNVWAIVQYSDELLYLATDRGLYSYNVRSDESLHVLRPSDSRKYLSDDSIINLRVDKKNNLWLGTRSDGALYWSPSSSLFTNVFNIRSGREEKILSNNQVWSLYHQAPSILWIGTDNGLNRYDLDRKKADFYLGSKDEKPNYSSATIVQILPADAEHLWLLTGDGLAKFNIITKQLVTIGLADEKQKDVFKEDYWGAKLDQQNRLYLVSNNGFQRYDAGTQELQDLTILNNRLDAPSALKFMGTLPSNPDKMLISMPSQLWLYDIHDNELSLLHELPEDLRSLLIGPDSWLIDEYNILWVTYPGYGLFGFDADTYQQKFFYNKENLLPSNSIYELRLDQSGYMWMSSHSGILRFHTKDKHIEQFGSQHGLANAEFNQDASSRLTDGRFVYGSPKGISIFDPLDFNLVTQNKISVSITDLQLFSNQLSLPLNNLHNTQLDLKHSDLGLSIYFSTLEYANQQNTRYQYSLIGTDTINYPATKNNKVVFPKLSAGDYEFVVSAFDATYGIQSEPAVLKISVAPAPWRSTIAYVFYAFSLLSIIFTWRSKRHKNAMRLEASHNAAVRSKNRLTLALNASNSDIWECRLSNNKFDAPRLTKELGYQITQTAVDFKQHLALIHNHDRPLYLTHWKRFITREDKDLDVTYRMLANDGSWLWFRDSGSVVESDISGKVILVTGTYTNVTETILDQENLRLFGEAFKHTHDWVVIYNHKKYPIAANEAFMKVFNLEQDADLGNALLQIYKAQRFGSSQFWKKLQKLKADEHWEGEDNVVFLDGSICHVLVHIQAIAKVHEPSKIENYLLIVSDINEQKAAEEKLLRMANYDLLTGLPNRALLLDRIKQGIDHTMRHKLKMALFFIDLDRFKHVNDSLGHQAGDQLLKIVAQRLTNKLRKEDTVARLGGDEFVIMIQDIERLDSVSTLVEELSAIIDLPIALMNQTVSVSSSIGITIFPGDGQNPEELLKNADIAMYYAKEKGRSNFQFFTAHMDELAKERLTLENQLKEAHHCKGFENYYQPIIDTITHGVEGFEILMRWPSENGMVPPDKFIPIAEELGLIVPMTIDAFERALPMLKLWRQNGFTGYLSVNLSARHFDNQSSIEHIMLLLEEHAIPVKAIRFEITESALMKDYEKALMFMQQIQQQGFIIALDDFGTGFSSLKYLKEFPINVIKVDKTFVDDIGKNKNNEAIILTTLSMAKQLEMTCVAEGIENSEQVEFFILHGCEHLQGYYFSKPVPAADVENLLTKNWRS